jgi:hypothetical protein
MPAELQSGLQKGLDYNLRNTALANSNKEYKTSFHPKKLRYLLKRF